MFHHLRLRSILFALLIIFVLVAGALQLQRIQHAYAINTPWLTTSGRFIKDSSGNTVILRGVSIIDVGLANTSRSRNAIQLTDMATNSADGWYARVVRFPVYPDAIDFTPGWNANPDAYYNNHLKPAIDNCIAKQIYCIIDWHYISDYTSSAVDTSTRNFWSYIAPKYANTPNVIFELYNEPINPDSWSTWKATAQPWVNLIRSFAPNNLILIGGPRWSQNVAEAATNPFSGSNLVYVCHIYPEHGGQGTWDSWFGNSSSTVPYFISEFGWRNGGSSPTSGTTSGFGTPFTNYLDSKGVSWTGWVFDTIWDPYIFDSNWNLLGGENNMGQFLKNFLAIHKDDNLPGIGSTPTNTPVTPTGPTPTRTRTPTITPTGLITNTPTVTPTNSSIGLKVQYKAADTNATDNGMKPHFIVVNSGTSSVSLSNLKIRYYFTDPATAYTPNCDYAVIGCSNITASFASMTPVTGADHYIEVGFTAGAGSLAAGANTGEIQGRFNKADWSNFNEADDYSFDPTKTAFADWTKVTLYNNGVLIWGTPPGGIPVTSTPSITLTSPIVTKTLTPTITPTFTRTITKTPTCAAPTAERLLVSPVTSPSTATSQVITVTLGHGQTVSITSEAGSFSSSSPVNGVFSITVTLVPNSVNHLQVQGQVSYSPGCPPYSLFTTVDSSGNPLTIVQGTVSNTPTPTRTPTISPTPTSGIGTCSPVSATITAPFTFDGAGTFCWQSTSLGTYVNSWNTTSVSINGVNISNLYLASGSYPAKIGGYWYISYNGPFAWSHFEAK